MVLKASLLSFLLDPAVTPIHINARNFALHKNKKIKNKELDQVMEQGLLETKHRSSGLLNGIKTY